MHIIIGGCGRVGAELADRLSDSGHDVVVVDTKEAAFDRLGGTFNGQTVTADITDKDALVESGIEQADALIAVSDLDNANLMAVEVATELFDVPKTIARLFNPQREESYRKIGVHYVSGTRLVAKAILNELQTGTFPAHIGFEGDVEIVEMRIHDGGNGATVGELEAAGSIRVAAFQRGLRVKVAASSDRLQSGDLVVAAIGRGAGRRLREYVEHPFAEDV